MVKLLAGVLLALTLLAAPAAQAADREVTYKVGPIGVGGFQTVRPKLIVPAPKVDGYVTYMHARLVDETGAPLNVQKVMLHHVVFLNRGRFAGDRKPKCGARFGEPFYGTGEENQALELPAGYGYRARRGDRWKMQAMFMSHSPQARKVFLEYTMRVSTQRLQPVTPYWVRVTNCRNEPSYSVPGGQAPGIAHLQSRAFRVPADGYIVAGGAHLHGGALDMTLRQPACHGRRLMGSDPAYGMPDDIAYNVKPVLHEPGPVNTAWFESATGVAVRKGETLRATAAYDAEFAHPGVMGVWHIYVAERKVRGARCAPLPSDRVEKKTSAPVRESPPRVVVPLTTLDAAGLPQTLAHPEGPLNFYASALEEPEILVDRNVFEQVNLSVPAGTTLKWIFKDPVPHKVSLANGPRSMGSPTLRNGKVYERQFTVPGVYQLFCYLHPMTMHQELTVRPDDAVRALPTEGQEAIGIADEPY
jgi:plastocyanin